MHDDDDDAAGSYYPSTYLSIYLSLSRLLAYLKLNLDHLMAVKVFILQHATNRIHVQNKRPQDINKHKAFDLRAHKDACIQRTAKEATYTKNKSINKQNKRKGGTGLESPPPPFASSLGRAATEFDEFPSRIHAAYPPGE